MRDSIINILMLPSKYLNIRTILCLILLTIGNVYGEVELSNSVKRAILNSKHDISLTFQKYFRLNKPQTSGTSSNQFLLSYYNNNDILRMDSSLMYFQEVKNFSFSIPEFYIKTMKKDFYISIGRKIIPWHINEQFWQLGHLNGLRSYTLNDDKQEGLTGVYIGKNLNKNLKLNFFISGLYIPQLNPGFDSKNGEIQNRTDWGVVRPTEVPINNIKTSIKYNINEQNILDIVIQKSLGLRLTYNNDDIEFSGFFIYKPESKLRINVDASLVGTTLTANTIPEVNHHLVSGIESKIHFGKQLFVFGIVDINPFASIGSDLDRLTIKLREQKAFKYEYFAYKANFENERYIHSSYYFSNSFLSGNISAIYYLTKHNEGNDTFSTSAVKWTKAIGFSLKKDLLDWWKIYGSLRYDFSKSDNVLNVENLFTYKKINLLIGLQLLKSPNDNSYWSSFRTNDSIYTNLTYRF